VHLDQAMPVEPPASAAQMVVVEQRCPRGASSALMCGGCGASLLRKRLATDELNFAAKYVVLRIEGIPSAHARQMRHPPPADRTAVPPGTVSQSRQRQDSGSASQVA
jgi:hypothetical protein